MEKKLDNRTFFITLIGLIIPITLQNLISSSLNMLDNLMIGELGESAIAAVGLVNQYFFIFTLTLSGINAGTSVFISQFYGKRDEKNIKKMFGLGIILSIMVSVLFFIPGFFMPDRILKVFVSDGDVIGLGADYLRVVSISFVLTAITQAFSTLIRSIGIPKPTMYGSIVGILINAFLNYCLIFGNFGFPQLGVVGAAIATSIARLVEMLFVVIVSYKVSPIKPNKKEEILAFDKNIIRAYFNTSSSVITNEILWALGMTAYSIIYAKIGITAVASMQIATTINNMFMVLTVGLATAAAIVIGNNIGSDKEDLALEYAKKLGVLAPLLGILVGGLVWLSSSSIVSIFNINQETYRMTVNILKIMALIAPLRFFNVLMIVGVFRGGGDTLYSMLVQLGTVWLFAIPLGYIGASYFNLPLEYVYLIISSEELVKIFFEASRLKSGKWIKNVTKSLQL